METKKIGDSEIKTDFKDLDLMIKKLAKKASVKVGILGSATYEGGATVAGIGAVHEFGYPEGGIPERSFIRVPLQTRGSEIEPIIKKKLKAGDLVRGDIKGILNIIGLAAVGIVVDSFDESGPGWPDITERTKKRKKSSKILIDTGELMKAISYEIDTGKG
jgi:hypothetical protein